MKVQYEKGPESLLIARAGVVAERGQAVEVPDEIGKLLIEQGWSQVGKSTPKKEGN